MASATLFAVLVAIALKVFVFGMFYVPTRSMEPTILAGDYVFVSKLAYVLGPSANTDIIPKKLREMLRLKLHNLDYNNVVVFNFPNKQEYPSINDPYIKRVVGLPGDTIAIRSGEVIRGIDAMHFATSTRMKYLGPIVIPKSGSTIDVDAESVELWKPWITKEGNSVDVHKNIVYINGNSVSSYTWKQDYYYVLGDNKFDSFDSRYWGFVADEDIIGKPIFVYWSEADSQEKLQRFGKLIQ